MQEFRPERRFDADPLGATDDDWVVRRACAHGLEDRMIRGHRCPACAGMGVGESITLGDPSCPVCRGSKAVVPVPDEQAIERAAREAFLMGWIPEYKPEDGDPLWRLRRVIAAALEQPE